VRIIGASHINCHFSALIIVNRAHSTMHVYANIATISEYLYINRARHSSFMNKTEQDGYRPVLKENILNYLDSGMLTIYSVTSLSAMKASQSAAALASNFLRVAAEAASLASARVEPAVRLAETPILKASPTE